MTSAAEAAAASRACTEQRLALIPLLRMDLSKASKASVETCKRAHALSQSYPVKFDAMLTHPAIAALFACGALHFRADE